VEPDQLTADIVISAGLHPTTAADSVCLAIVQTSQWQTVFSGGIQRLTVMKSL